MPDGKDKKNENKIEEKARIIAEPILNASGYVIWDVIFEKEGAMQYLRVLFDSVNNDISSDECEKMTAPINAAFDRQDFIQNVDILEIGSPGLTRRLRHSEHFKKSIGLKVRILIRGINGKTEVLYGTLTGYDENTSTISLIETADVNANKKPVKKKQETESQTDKQNDLNKQNKLIEIEIKKCVRINLDL